MQNFLALLSLFFLMHGVSACSLAGGNSEGSVCAAQESSPCADGLTCKIPCNLCGTAVFNEVETRIIADGCSNESVCVKTGLTAPECMDSACADTISVVDFVCTNDLTDSG
jgi:hypothetical protein